MIISSNLAAEIGTCEEKEQLESKSHAVGTGIGGILGVSTAAAGVHLLTREGASCCPKRDLISFG